MNKVSNAEAFRTDIDQRIARFPEIFPAEIVKYRLPGHLGIVAKFSLTATRISSNLSRLDNSAITGKYGFLNSCSVKNCE